MRPLLLLLVLLIFGNSPARALTWDEPWADSVIRKSSSFVLGNVLSSDPRTGIRIQVFRTLGGKPVPDTVLISGFYDLRICSNSGDVPEFRIQKTDSCYFFLYEDADQRFSIATPTTGFDYVLDGQVIGTYRHSYHQAQVPVAAYELTMGAIFNHYHGRSYDAAAVRAFVLEQLGQPPAGFGEQELGRFFRQHAALETVYHLRLQVPETLLLPFLRDRKNFHNQVSGARALGSIPTGSARGALLAVVGDSTYRGFVQVMCLRALGPDPKDFKSRLQQLEETATDEEDDFGGNLMDPRICTDLPSVKKAIRRLLDQL
ncbi:hypothetical protein [Flaviaesturariibacter amylovorans]|uniref:DUF4369 domain-containing protein n=1 Tax=Flaviaesturariibacter amylovorans TaxID=1084520 RepID=A0ABP8HKF5_9BACT